MAIIDALRSGVRIANQVTKNGGVQATVMYEHCTGSDQYGPLYASPVPMLAIVDEKEQQVRTKGGILSASRCQLSFLDVAAIKAATGSDGRIRDIDIITLPDETGSTVLAVGGFVDGGTGHGLYQDVWI